MMDHVKFVKYVTNGVKCLVLFSLALIVSMGLCACSPSSSSSSSKRQSSSLPNADFTITEEHEWLSKEGSDITIDAYIMHVVGRDYEEIDTTKYDIIEGLESLHAPEDCEACAELRSMYKSGKVKRVFCPVYQDQVLISGLSIPLSSKKDKVTLYQCEDGELKAYKGEEGFMAVSTIIPQENSWSFRISDLSPMGVAY